MDNSSNIEKLEHKIQSLDEKIAKLEVEVGNRVKFETVFGMLFIVVVFIVIF